MLNRALVHLLPLVPRPLVWRFSKRYIAGVHLVDALDTVERLNEGGMCATLDVLGEDSKHRDEALASRDLYLDALAGIKDRGLDCNLSVKLSQMGLRFDESLCRSITRELVAAVQKGDNFLRIDMEDSSVTDVTLGIYRELRRDFHAVGTVIQAYLRRTAADVEQLLDSQQPTHLRLCKGIYTEPVALAFKGREEVRDSFKSLLERLLADGGAARLGIATHDPPLVAHARETISSGRIAADRFEFQMLLGVAEGMRSELVAEGHQLRVYVPFGEAWFAYSHRRLKENPKIAGHIVRNLFRRHR